MEATGYRRLTADVGARDEMDEDNREMAAAGNRWVDCLRLLHVHSGWDR